MDSNADVYGNNKATGANVTQTKTLMVTTRHAALAGGTRRTCKCGHDGSSTGSSSSGSKSSV